jgi:hypothetical protein
VREKKVGKAVSLAKPEGRPSGGQGGRADLGLPPVIRKSDGAPNDGGDAGRRPDGQGVLRQPEQLEQVSAGQADAKERRASAYEPKSEGLTLFRYRYSRAKAAIQKGKCKTHEVCISFQAATEIIEKLDKQSHFAKKALKSIDEFEDIMLNPNWDKKETYDRIDLMIATLHSTLTNFKDIIE